MSTSVCSAAGAKGRGQGLPNRGQLPQLPAALQTLARACAGPPSPHSSYLKHQLRFWWPLRTGRPAARSFAAGHRLGRLRLALQSLQEI